MSTTGWGVQVYQDCDQSSNAHVRIVMELESLVKQRNFNEEGISDERYIRRYITNDIYRSSYDV